MSAQSAQIMRPLTLPAVLQLILHRAACLVQPTRIDFDSRELTSMICEPNVNRIIQFTGVLRVHLEDAHAGTPEPDLLPLLKALRQVTYAGMPLATELEDWAISEGIHILKRVPYIPGAPEAAIMALGGVTCGARRI